MSRCTSRRHELEQKYTSIPSQSSKFLRVFRRQWFNTIYLYQSCCSDFSLLENLGSQITRSLRLNIFVKRENVRVLKHVTHYFLFKKRWNTLPTYTKVQSYNNPACFGIWFYHDQEFYTKWYAEIRRNNKRLCSCL